MDESLTERRRVKDEGPRVVNFCQVSRKGYGLIAHALTLGLKEAPANSVPAAAVIQRVQTLFGITGLKARVGGDISVL